jgi:hypothetical protein
MAQRFLTLALVGALAAACVFALILTPRPDLSIVIVTPRVAFKFLFALTLVGAAGALAFKTTHPEARPSLWSVLVPVLALLATGIAAELVASSPAAWWQLLIGSNALACVTLVPLLSLLPLSAILAAMRHGAPSRPRLAGAVAGLLAGGIGAAVYAVHCPDDSPLFVAAWYGVSIAAVATLGTVLGARLLRW